MSGGVRRSTFNAQLPTTKSKRQWVQAAFFLRPADLMLVTKIRISSVGQGH
jgi:hypothetical protein